MSDPIKALILTHNYPRYKGDFSGVFLELLARRLPEHGVLPIILAPHDEKAADRETFGEVEIHRFRYENDESKETLAYRGDMDRRGRSGPLKLRRFLGKFREEAETIIKRGEVDVLAGQWLVPAGLVMRSLSRQSELPKLPMILSSHGTDVRLAKKFSPITKWYMGKWLKSLRRWTVVSEFLKEDAARLCPLLAEKDRIEILHLPHNDAVLKPNPSISREENLIVSVTRFTKQKRVKDLVKAFQKVQEAHPTARLVLYGSGHLESKLRELIETLSLQDAVTINAPVPQSELVAIYNRATMVVLNSYKEGFGLALSEAMMCGAPVIGTNSGGIRDVIRHEKTGLLVEEDSEPELTAAILRLLKDVALRSSLAKAGHESAVRRFAPGPLAARYAELLREAARSQTR